MLRETLFKPLAFTYIVLIVMSRSQGLENILSEARRQEKAYEWITAAELYKTASNGSFESSGLLKASEFHERIGLCYRLGAMQADIPNSFTERMLLAAETYKKAANLSEKMEGKEARVSVCLAMASYVSYWLAPSPLEKKELIEECNRLKTKVFELYRKAGDQRESESGKAYNELLMCLCESDSDRCTLEWECPKREKMIRNALSLGEKAIITFSQLKDNHELAKAYSVTGKLYETARHICELEENKKEFGQKSWSYLKKAIELNKKIDDGRLSCLTNIWFGISTADWAGGLDESLKCFEDAMYYAKKLKDRYLKGQAAHG